uniref:Splicing factor U2AF 26 kDa subunit n=1 Tax=Syphacia muris TaxID=451379 RepID=A0A0N5AXY7_9BILA
MTLSSCENESSSSRTSSPFHKNDSGCPFYNKIGACRHGNKCSKLHIIPEASKTIILKNLHYGFNPLIHAGSSENTAQREFDEFYAEVFSEIDEQYGRIEEMIVSDNIGEHMIGNVYIKFSNESDAQNAVKHLNNRWFDGRPIHCELSPVEDFKAACCRQYDYGECDRGRFCNFLHIKEAGAAVKRRLLKRQQRLQRKRLKNKYSNRQPKRSDDHNNSSNDIGDNDRNSLPKKYQITSSDDETSETDTNSRTTTSESSTPIAFREDRYPSDASDSDSGTDSIVLAHMQMIRKQKWEDLRNRLEYQPKWDDDREQSFIFSLL